MTNSWWGDLDLAPYVQDLREWGSVICFDAPMIVSSTNESRRPAGRRAEDMVASSGGVRSNMTALAGQGGASDRLNYLARTRLTLLLFATRAVRVSGAVPPDAPSGVQVMAPSDPYLGLRNRSRTAKGWVCACSVGADFWAWPVRRRCDRE
jgi:hypothetical protein